MTSPDIMWRLGLAECFSCKPEPAARDVLCPDMRVTHNIFGPEVADLSSAVRGVRKAVGIRRGAISGNMKVSFQAARSIG